MTTTKPAFRNPPSYTYDSPAQLRTERLTVNENLIYSAQMTADAWEKPAWIAIKRATENHASGELVVFRDKPDGRFAIAATVSPDGTVELGEGFYRNSITITKDGQK